MHSIQQGKHLISLIMYLLQHVMLLFWGFLCFPLCNYKLRKGKATKLSIIRNFGLILNQLFLLLARFQSLSSFIAQCCSKRWFSMPNVLVQYFLHCGINKQDRKCMHSYPFAATNSFVNNGKFLSLVLKVLVLCFTSMLFIATVTAAVTNLSLHFLTCVIYTNTKPY